MIEGALDVQHNLRIRGPPGCGPLTWNWAARAIRGGQFGLKDDEVHAGWAVDGPALATSAGRPLGNRLKAFSHADRNFLSLNGLG